MKERSHILKFYLSTCKLCVELYVCLQLRSPKYVTYWVDDPCIYICGQNDTFHFILREIEMMFSIDKPLHSHLFPQTDNFLAFDVYLIYILSQKRTFEQMYVSYPLIANKSSDGVFDFLLNSCLS